MMEKNTCRVRNLCTSALSGFFDEKDALSSGGHYLRPDADGWLDATGLTGLCVVCENCGSAVEEASGNGELSCPDCGESTFRVLQTFCLITIKRGFAVRWHVSGLYVAIDVPDNAREGIVSIRYTVDGSDPTLSSCAYTGPIGYSKSFAPIRAAVFYGDARSQIIEWDYGRAESNRLRIQKQSSGQSEPKPGRPAPRPPSVPAPSAPKPSAPKKPVPKKPETEKPAKDDEDNKGCGCLTAGVMLIAGILLISNGWSIIGWGLAIFAALAIFGMFQDDEK